jgi:hypothetical protein
MAGERLVQLVDRVLKSRTFWRWPGVPLGVAVSAAGCFLMVDAETPRRGPRHEERTTRSGGTGRAGRPGPAVSGGMGLGRRPAGAVRRRPAGRFPARQAVRRSRPGPRLGFLACSCPAAELVVGLRKRVVRAMPFVCQACRKEVEGAQCPFCGKPTVEGTLQQEQAYRWLAVVLALSAVGVGLIVNLIVILGDLYLSHLPRDARGGMGMALGMGLAPLVWGLAALGAVVGFFGLINAGGSRMWYWAGAALLGLVLSVRPLVW